MKKLEELGISPAPWEAHKQFVMARDDGSVVAATNYADARLFAAAPELYEALHEMVEWCDYDCLSQVENYKPMIAKGKSALAKASGEEAK